MVLYTYDAYGNTGESGTLTNSIAYTGAIKDDETGLYYMNARYYDPETGRFISQDSYRGDGERFWHLYAYCKGDPINFIDPTRHVAASAIIGGGVVGAIAGAVLSVILADALNLKGIVRVIFIGVVTVAGAALGAVLGPYVAKLSAKAGTALRTKLLRATGKTTKIAKPGKSFGKLGKLIKPKRIKINWSKTMKHVLDRLAERGMSKSLVNSIVKTGKVIDQGGKYLYVTRKGAVVVDKAGKIITVYSARYFDSNMKNVVKQLFR